MKIAVIGAGSHFTLNLLRSMYQTARHSEYSVRFMDIRQESLDALARLTRKMNEVKGKNFHFTFHSEIESAVEGADHVLISYAVDFPDSFLRTCWIMKDHGINFVEGETATPGALMATLRHLPPLLNITEVLKKHTNGAWLHIINNPLPRLILGVMKGTGYSRVIGHCHGTLHTRKRISELTDTPDEDIDFFVAGINHFHIIQKAVDRRNGKDLLPVLKDLPKEKDEEWKEKDYTQWCMFQELGYFIGHGIWHNFDYLPYANQRLFKHSDTNTWDRANVFQQGLRTARPKLDSTLMDPASIRDFLEQNESEQIFHTMRALSGDIEPYLFLAGNLPNDNHISNLPNGSIVELPATISKNSISLHQSLEKLPLFFENMLRIQLTIHDLSVRAVLECSKQAAIEAIACDPSFRDCDCSPGQLLDEMVRVNKGLVSELK